MANEKKNSGGQLNLLVPSTDVGTVCEWVREALHKEPIEVSQPLAEESQIEIYFETLLEAEIAKKALPPELNIRLAEAREYLEQDWTTFWQHHFKTTELGQNLRIVPEWEEAPEDGRINIIINPGLSFGTGGHFTTKFCLEALEKAVRDFAPATMIDAGTGSGILSIAAIKLGTHTQKRIHGAVGIRSYEHQAFPGNAARQRFCIKAGIDPGFMQITGEYLSGHVTGNPAIQVCTGTQLRQCNNGICRGTATGHFLM